MKSTMMFTSNDGSKTMYHDYKVRLTDEEIMREWEIEGEGYDFAEYTFDDYEGEQDALIVDGNGIDRDGIIW